MTVEQRLTIIGNVASEIQYQVSKGHHPSRAELFNVFEAIRFLVDKSDNFINLNRDQIDDALGIKLTDDEITT